jgi:DNA-binding SARP family transcriptional activator
MGASRPASDAALEVRLLGPLEVSRDQQPLPLGGPKPRALLAALALETGRVVSVDRLVENLWPGNAPETAPHAVQVYVSQLRKKLGPLITRRPPGYLLELDAERVDAHRFARLTEEGRAALQGGSPEAAESALRDALALWRGPALADFLYEPFAQAEIARLEELRLVALEERIDADLELGRHVELVSELEALVQAEPLRERPRGQLMLALYRSGRQADALAAYRAARDALVDELGIEPGPDLKQLEAAILRQDESLAPAPSAAVQLQTRRLATVVSFGVEVVGEGLDVETEDRLLETAAAAVSAAVVRHGGVSERLADGSLTAVFGAPVAHEDDPLRAARAGVEARQALASVDGLELRVGIATGEVVARGASATGAPRREAARFRAQAEIGEVAVGEATAARLRPAATLERKGGASILVELAPPAPAFERRQEAPFVGRRKELGVLRKALRDAKSQSRAQLVAVLGPAGIGKTRLALEVAGRAKGVTVLSGRCLSYGDGITYWPLREVVRDAPPSEEREAVLAALDAETPPPAAEIGWIFRRLCEALARAKPLVLVFDDVHWAEPTFLELVEQLADRGEGSILVVCVAREELAEEHPDFLAERAEQIVLDTLTPEETDALLDGLGATLADEERGHIVETAGGNPLFVEQLLALAAEGGLGEARPLPGTIQALLAARLDRLGPGERAVLERGSIVLRNFERDDVTALLAPEAAPTVDTHLGTLVARGFLRRVDTNLFRFRHDLVQESVYRAAPKRLRAELHERFADRLDLTAADLPELDEFVGYHLEQAYRLRTELGDSGRGLERLSEDAGRRLGAAGMRAWRRDDAPATSSLLRRATELLPGADSWRLELLCELGLAERRAGDPDAAEERLRMAVEQAASAGDGRVELRARIEGSFVQLFRVEEGSAQELLALTTDAIPTFEALGDHRSLGRAWLLSGWVQGGVYCQYQDWESAVERALEEYLLAGSPASTCLGQLSSALYWGPAPVVDAIERCERLLTLASDLAGRAQVLAYLGGLEAQRGRFDEARARLAEARGLYVGLGHKEAVAIQCDGVLGDVELIAGDHLAAEDALRAACDYFESTRNRIELATRAPDLAEALYRQDQLEDAEHWTSVSEQSAASDYLSAQLSWLPVQAKILARRGAFDAAVAVGSQAVTLAESTDGLNRTAKAQRDLGEVLRLAGRADEASVAFKRAIELYELKGNVVGAAQVRSRQDDLALV